MMDKVLFTPGPLTTSATVKRAMLRDLGSRDREFLDLVHGIRQELLHLACVSQEEGFEAVLVPGSGTYGVEAVVSSVIPRQGKLLVLQNGAYAARIAAMARAHGIAYAELAVAEDCRLDPDTVAIALQRDPTLTHVALVHCETSTGMLNPLTQIGERVRRAGKTFIVDSMSGFGALPVDLKACCIDFLISSANKCIEGVPGFAFVLARHEALLRSEGNARSLALDLHAQWRGFERDGQFRFTPPTHAVLAFVQALSELAEEGGVFGRGRRYSNNQHVLVEGMRALGFRTLLPPEFQSPIITTFLYPADPRFNFEQLYASLSDKGFLIYPGKITRAACFRIGTVGRIGETQVKALLAALKASLLELGFALPLCS